MKKLALLSLLVAAAAGAQSQFRQRIRNLTVHGQVALNDDGSVVSDFNCTAPSEQPMLDGGTWPLRILSVQVDGGMPNAVINTCARTIEQRNLLDGGLQ